MSESSGVSRISFRGGGGGGGFKFFGKSGGICMARCSAWQRHAYVRGVRGHVPRENFLKRCNSVRSREYFAKILSKNNLKNSHFLYKNNR